MTSTQTAVIYARQSFDRHLDQLAVDRQLKLCRDLCAERGWTVVGEYVDNDTSATTGVDRPQFNELLTARPQRIVAWHLDRLLRVTRDLERVITLGVNVHTVMAGHLDLSNPAGRAVARTVTAWSTYETEQKAERQRAANRQRAEKGAARWVVRPFGFDQVDGRVVIVEVEAAVLRAAAAEVMAGATLAEIARQWAADGLLTTKGQAWSVTSVKRCLLNPRLVGKTTYRGEDMGKHSPAILTDAEFDALQAKLTDPRRKLAPSTRLKYPLSGLIRCGRCDAPMYAMSTSSKTMAKYWVYRCLKCARVRRLDHVDKYVTGLVLSRLTKPDAKQLLVPGVDLAELQADVSIVRERRDGLAALLADGLLSADAVRVQATKLGEQITDLERQIDSAMGSSPLAPLIDADDIVTAYESMTPRQQRAVVDAVVTVFVEAAGRGVRFSPDHLRVVWKI